MFHPNGAFCDDAVLSTVVGPEEDVGHGHGVRRQGGVNEVQGSFFVRPDRCAFLDDDFGVYLCYFATAPFVANNERERRV